MCLSARVPSRERLVFLIKRYCEQLHTHLQENGIGPTPHITQKEKLKRIRDLKITWNFQTLRRKHRTKSSWCLAGQSLPRQDTHSTSNARKQKTKNKKQAIWTLIKIYNFVLQTKPPGKWKETHWMRENICKLFIG